MGIQKKLIQTIDNSQAIYEYTLSNGNITAKILNYGGIITSLTVPDKNEIPTDIVLGFTEPSRYLSKHPHLGALTGRVAGRIENARFSIDGKIFEVTKNFLGKHHIHGGTNAIDKAVWNSAVYEENDAVCLKLTLFRPNGDAGFPGNVNIEVLYKLNASKQFSIEYYASTDAATPLVLTNHSYFNLNGESSGVTVEETSLIINADKFLPINSESIPTGIENVKNTPFDLRRLTSISQNINSNNSQIKLVDGFDHAWLLNMDKPNITAIGNKSGIKMEITTDQKAVVCYTGNGLDGSLIGKSGVPYIKHYGICFETQAEPNAINNPLFSDVVIRPGKPYKQKTVWSFFH